MLLPCRLPRWQSKARKGRPDRNVCQNWIHLHTDLAKLNTLAHRSGKTGYTCPQVWQNSTVWFLYEYIILIIRSVEIEDWCWNNQIMFANLPSFLSNSSELCSNTLTCLHDAIFLGHPHFFLPWIFLSVLSIIDFYISLWSSLDSFLFCMMFTRS